MLPPGSLQDSGSDPAEAHAAMADAPESGKSLSTGGLSLILHLTDIHVSAFSPDPSRLADLHTLATTLLPLWTPDAIIISGMLSLGHSHCTAWVSLASVADCSIAWLAHHHMQLVHIS